MGKRIPITRLTAFFAAFPNEKACEDYLFKLLYPNGFICPRCGSKSFGRIKGRKELQCHRCRHQTSLTKGSIMQNTHLALRKWFLAIFLLTHDKRGYSALSLAHELNVSRQTATYLVQRIRAAMALSVIPNALGGIIEIDDAYIGAKSKTRGRGTEKVSFMVAVEKSKAGNVSLRASESLKGDDYKTFAYDHISHSSKIRSDGFRAICSGLASYAGHRPETFCADDCERSLPTVHHIISNFKAMVAGTYHGVRKDFMQSYMDEFSYRYNNRRNADVFHTLLSDVCFSPKQRKAMILALSKAQDLGTSRIAA